MKADKKDIIVIIGIIIGLILIFIPEPATTMFGVFIVIASLMLWGIKV